MVLTLCYNYLLPHSLWVTLETIQFKQQCWINLSNFQNHPATSHIFIYTSEYSLFSTLELPFLFLGSCNIFHLPICLSKICPVTSLNHDFASSEFFQHLLILSNFKKNQALVKVKIHMPAQTGRHKLTYSAKNGPILLLMFLPLEWFEERASIKYLCTLKISGRKGKKDIIMCGGLYMSLLWASLRNTCKRFKSFLAILLGFSF